MGIQYDTTGGITGYNVDIILSEMGYAPPPTWHGQFIIHGFRGRGGYPLFRFFQTPPPILVGVQEISRASNTNCS